MDKGKIAEISIGDWDLECQVVYIPYWDRFDDWRKCAWNPMTLVEVDIIDIVLTERGTTIDYDNLNGEHQEEIMKKVMDWEEDRDED